ncbi:MAG: hypothetical protein OXE96_02000 [Gemmatimonadetes bacterium]|nr:hypothetical protein [Gemmatimonadota bacterium]
MAAKPSPDRPTHAELAAQIPDPPPDASNEAIIFARKTLTWTLVLGVLFIGSAVVYNFIMQ